MAAIMTPQAYRFDIEIMACAFQAHGVPCARLAAARPSAALL